MVKATKKFLYIIFVLIILTGIFTINADAYDSQEHVSLFRQNNNEIICIAHRGDWHSYPENSAEAVSAASEYGVISIDIKLTADKKPILMADETVDRMCITADGKAAAGSVSSYTLAQMKKFYLRSDNGSDKTSKTDFRPASLEEAAAAAGNEAALMLNLSCADFGTVYENVKALGITDSVIFRFSENTKTIQETVSGAEDITFCGNYQGNIIFLASGTVKNCFDHRINTVELGSTNGHGVLYDRFLMKYFDSQGKAMVSMVNGRCGKRPDSESGWDDLISRGYSVIETDYPKELSEYIKKISNAKSELERYLSLYEDTALSAYTTDTETAFTAAVNNSEAIISKSSSLSEIEGARFDLQSAKDNLTAGAKKAVTLSFRPTPGRIIAIVLCGTAFVGSQIFLYKKRVQKK